MTGSNPYFLPDAKEPSLDAMKQKPFRGCSQERQDVVAAGMRDFFAWIAGKEYVLENVERF